MQVFEPLSYGVIRISVVRTEVDEVTLDWKEDIAWDDLQRIKCEVGFADQDVVEVFPPARDVVNVANMRHLWVLPRPLPFIWRQGPDDVVCSKCGWRGEEKELVDGESCPSCKLVL